jgi:hypothetical protein
MNILSKEPAVLVGLVQAVLALAVSFGLDLTPEQVGAIMAVTSALLALLVRQAVVSPATIAKAEEISQPITGLAGRLVRIAGGGN